ncbi:MAG: sialate O-acetylesterase [Planctomycetota bacterium]
MTHVRLLAAVALSLGLIGAEAPAPSPSASTLKVFVLAGQSNMVGFGFVEADPERNGGRGSLEHLVRDPETKGSYAHLADASGDWIERDDVWISFGGARERDGALAPGYGARDDRIGPELGFGTVVGDAIDEPVLLVKVAWGGKSLAVDFRPPSAGGDVGPSYTALFERVREVLADLDERFPDLQHDDVEIVGFGWHQGWNDRIDQARNDAYEENLAAFVRDARAELGVPKLPFVVAETGMSGRDETHPRALSLMAAQRAVAERVEFRGNVAFVGTRDFFRPKELSPSGQAYHWNENAETYYLIGAGMGEAMLELLGARK